MEVSRNMGPEDGFLENVRKLATDNGIVLIFDECTSGFRQTFGGLHKLYGVEPDMAMFGKALGNGWVELSIMLTRPIDDPRVSRRIVVSRAVRRLLFRLRSAADVDEDLRELLTESCLAF